MQEITQPDPQGQEGIHRRLIAGTAGKLMSLAINFGEQILLVPIFLYFWGPDRFADWTVLIATASFVGLIDLGLQNYYSNGLQLALSRGDERKFSRMLHEAAALYLGLAAIGAAAILALAGSVDWTSALNLTGAGGSPPDAVLILLGLHFVAMLPFGIGNAVYRAHGDFVLGIMVGNLLRLALIAAIVGGLSVGINAAGLAGIHVAVAIIAWLAMVLHQTRRYTDLRYGIRLPDRVAMKEVFAVAPLYAAVLGATMLTTHGTIFLVSGLAANGAAAALLYRTLRTLIGMIRLIPDQIMHVTGVEMARQYAQDDAGSLSRTYGFFSRFAGGLCGGFAGMVAYFAPPFFPLWTLGDIPFDATVFWPLLAAAAFAGPSLAGTSVLFFINKPAGMAGAHIAAGLATLILCAVLIPELGAAGAAWAVLAAEALILSTVIPWQTARILSINAPRMILHTHLYMVASFVISALCAWAAVTVCGAETLPRLVLAGIVWTALAAGPAFFLLFDGAQREWLLHQLLTRTGLRRG